MSVISCLFSVFPGPRFLSEDDVRDRENPFVQLVTGVMWLLRNGQVYISESIKAECNKTQNTGTAGTGETNRGLV